MADANAGEPPPTATPATPVRLPGVCVTSITPGKATAECAALLIAGAIRDGANVAALVPVETGIEEPCAQGSTGALVRWAAGHLDDPRLVTPFAYASALPTQHAAEDAGTLPHPASLERAYTELTDGRSAVVVCDAIGMCDPVLPSLTMLTLATRWALSAVCVVELTPAAVHHTRLLTAMLAAADLRVEGVCLCDHAASSLSGDDAMRVRDTIAAQVDCPVLVIPRIDDPHDRSTLLTVADATDVRAILRRAFPSLARH
jgi:dethiobiotin synthetase